MQTIEQLRDKIDAAEGLHQVVRTMKGLAAVNIRQYQRAAESLQQYAQTVEQGLAVALRTGRDELQLRRPTRTEADSPVLAVAFGSDQGMVGRFNSTLADHLAATLDRAETPRHRRWVLVAGRRLASRLAADGADVRRAFDLPASAEGIAPHSQQVLPAVQELRDRGAGRVWLVHHVPAGGSAYHATTRDVFPLSMDWLTDLRDRDWPGPSLPIVRAQPREMLAGLIDQYVFVSLFRAFAASMAAENASRLASMQAAESNIEDRLAHLRQQYHRRRQGEITSELLDVMAGFEAARPH